MPSPQPRIEDDDAEFLEQLEALSPLTALNPEEVDELTTRQQVFLVSFINTGSLAFSRKAVKIDLATWRKWLEDEKGFKRIYDIVKSPPVFMATMANAIILEATKRHLALLRDERTSVQQWAIERAYQLKPAMQGSNDTPTGGKDRLLTHDDVRSLASGIAEGLDEASRRRLERTTPFIDGEFTVKEITSGQVQEVNQEAG